MSPQQQQQQGWWARNWNAFKNWWSNAGTANGSGPNWLNSMIGKVKGFFNGQANQQQQQAAANQQAQANQQQTPAPAQPAPPPTANQQPQANPQSNQVPAQQTQPPAANQQPQANQQVPANPQSNQGGGWWNGLLNLFNLGGQQYNGEQFANDNQGTIGSITNWIAQKANMDHATVQKYAAPFTNQGVATMYDKAAQAVQK